LCAGIWVLHSVRICCISAAAPRIVSLVSDTASAIVPSPGLEGRRRTTSDYVAEALRDAISSGRLEDGAVLNQVHIADQLGVSRVPVREAMRMLEAEGLIDASAHRSPTVRALSRARVDELLELRALLEGHLTAAATPNADARTLAKLSAINGEMRKTTDSAAWIELNREFHTVLTAAARRPETLEVLDGVRLRAERYVQASSSELSPARIKSVTREHATIIKAVKAGDAEAARRAAEEHVLSTMRFLDQQRTQARSDKQ
jgi:DNA-binding GntR family transcriptional regulator